MWMVGFLKNGATVWAFTETAATRNDILISGGRCITMSLQNPKNGARRTTLKKGFEVPGSARRRDEDVMRDALYSFFRILAGMYKT